MSYVTTKALAVVNDAISTITNYATSNTDSQPLNDSTKDQKLQESYIDFKVKIGIDFGTDGLGLAFALKGDDNIKIYNQQSDKHKHYSYASKIKTQILFNDTNKAISFGNDAKQMYKKLTKKEIHSWKLFQRFKPLLEDVLQDTEHDDMKSNDNTNNIQELTAINGGKCELETVFIAMFQHLHNEAKNYIQTLTSDEISNEEIQWIIAMPGIWSQKTCNRMKEFILKSGLVYKYIKNQCKMVWESDCAILSIQNNLCVSNKNQNDEKTDEKQPLFMKGDKYILIDAGAVIVDISVCQIVNKFTIKELIPPRGGYWGSYFIDDQYIQLLEHIFSGEWITEFKKQRPDIYGEIIHNFQTVKMSFFEDENETIYDCPLPNDFCEFLEEKCFLENCQVEDKVNQAFRKINFVDECLEIDVCIWKKMFDSMIIEIIKDISEILQLSELNGCSYKYLCLTGGFVSSKYFQFKMEQEFGLNSKYKLQLIIVKKPIIAEGAVYMSNINFIKEQHLNNKIDL
eukprot:280667_1